MAASPRCGAERATVARLNLAVPSRNDPPL